MSEDVDVEVIPTLPNWSPLDPLEEARPVTEAAITGWQFCDVVKVNAGQDGQISVVLRGGQIPSGPGPVNDVWFFIVNSGQPAGPGQERIFAVALTACSARQKVWAWLTDVTSGSQVQMMHIAPTGP